MRYVTLLLSMLLALPALAAEDATPPPPQLDAMPEQPKIPKAAKSGQVLDPDKSVMDGERPDNLDDYRQQEDDAADDIAADDIKIIRKGKKTIHEYYRGGQIYMIKVIPDIGPPYYFIDSNGDGRVDMNRGDRNLDTNVNMWKILEWE